jgi:2-oxoisovalerate dehydrogenase E1 component beta subunit
MAARSKSPPACWKKFGETRVIDTPISESAIVGAAIGAALMGLETDRGKCSSRISISCAFDQITNFAAKCRYRWGAGIPIVVRAPAAANIHGGPFHSRIRKCISSTRRDSRSLCPSTAVRCKRLIKSAIRDPDPVIYFEHKFLYRWPRVKEELPSV